MSRLVAPGRNSVLRYFSVLATGSMLGLLLSFLVQAYLSRVVTVETFGQINYARILIGYLILALNFGFETYFLRALVSNELSPGRAVALQLSARLPLAILMMVGLLIWAGMGHWSVPRLIVTLYGLTTLAYVLNIDWLFQVREQFSALAAINLGRGLLVLAGTLLLVRSPHDTVKYVALVALAELARVLYQWWRLRPRLERVSLRQLLLTVRTSIPISASFFMISLYYNIDSIMLGHFRSDAAVAIYVAAYNILTLAILPTSLLYQAFGPTLARSPWNIEVFRRYFGSTMALALVVFVVLFLLHRFVILTLYGEKYEASIPVLMLLSFNILSSYLAGAFANPINIWGQHIKYFWIVASGATVNVILNFLLIPRYGIPAAVGATITSELVVALLAMWAIFRGFRTYSEVKPSVKVEGV
ncbi:oligosaccharide flippase family protein [Deinococcus phoenicis]|uniref:oligosaccharide flippase family protein n=1 Tax=Deinococcus phoenicis TaxID=1476583 RepID=UPI001267C36C|nr:oligosaccharide flippase family protein [Deinococcus phoenicis]